MTDDIRFWHDGYSVVITCIPADGTDRLPFAMCYGLQRKAITSIDYGRGPLVAHVISDTSTYRPLDRLSVVTLTGKAPDHWIDFVKRELAIKR